MLQDMPFWQPAETTLASAVGIETPIAAWVAVGTPVARHPPHRSVREGLPHTALTLGW